MNETQKSASSKQPDAVKHSFSMEQMSMLMSKIPNKDGLDMALLSDKQREKVVDIMLQSENHSFEYAKEHLRVTESLNKKALDVSIFNQKTLRIALLTGLSAIFVLFILVLVFAKEYVSELISLLAGIVGGYGLRGGLNDLIKKTPSIKIDAEDGKNPERS